MSTHPAAELARLVAHGEAVVAGCLSGTSGDGIDVGLTRFHPVEGGEERPRDDVGELEPLGFRTVPFEPDLAVRVRSVLDGAPLDARGLALLDRDLGTAFGRATRTVARELGLPLHLVASHGQTVWHHDGREPEGRATLQLGNPDFCSEPAGAAVVSGFRDGDVAAGGEGAPLSALADGVVFARARRPLAVLNLGGLANLTLLGSDGALEAFDTGPAGSLLDGLARRLLDLPFDPEGAHAAGGRADPALLARLLAHSFLAQPPPKSTGRDTFGEAWIDDGLASPEARGLPAADLLATGVALVAEAVARGLRASRVVREPLRELVVAGGGHRHRPLLEALARRSGLPVVASSCLGVDPDAREALVFAVLGARCALGLPSTRSSVTGAREGRVLGRLTLPRSG